jgi:hypothetical protein
LRKKIEAIEKKKKNGNGPNFGKSSDDHICLQARQLLQQQIFKTSN